MINIGVISYATGAAFFTVLALILLTARRELMQKIWFVIASATIALWAAVSAYEAYNENLSILSQVLELARDLVLLVFLLRLLGTGHGLVKEQHKILRVVMGVTCAFTLAMVLLVLNRNTMLLELSWVGYADSLILGHMFLSILGLVLIEQLVRNTGAETLRAMKYLYLGIGTIFAYDFYLYADAMMFQRIDMALWDARGFVNAIAVPVIGIAIARDPRWSLDIFVSRRIVFHTTALLGAGVYLMAMGLGGYYVREYGGTWGVVAQTIFFFGASLVLLILMFSVPLRARLRVLINKHFFHYKYDYREEWLRFIRTLSSNETDIQLPERAIRAIAQMIDSPGGVLWMRREDGHYEPAAKWNMEPPLSANEQAGSSFIRFLEIQKWVINLDEYRRDPGLYQSLGDLAMPSWLRTLPDAWLIAPLILQEKLHGFVVLARSPAVRRHFNWEDCDLLKTTGTQAASHLVQHAASQALAEARQFEAFNRLSTYVVHDLKNLISQLSLVVSNASRHRNNPLFMENVISTVENSVSKMNRLLTRMCEGVQADSQRMVNLAKLLEEVVHDARASKPAPVLECVTRDLVVAADRDQLASVMGHVVRNAQDATPEDGHVTVRVKKVNGHAVVEVEDTGCGMDEAFIRARLFRPFQTTKGDSGMGIGAYEAREFVRSLGGDVEVESKPGTGTIFRIQLPDRPALEPVRYQQHHQ